MDSQAFFKISYGLFLISAHEEGRDNACIANTVMQLTDSPRRISVVLNKSNLTCDMIAKTKRLAVSVLSNDAPFALFRHFGFQSGRDTDKFDGSFGCQREANGLISLNVYINAVFSANVIDVMDVGTHMLFVAEVEDARTLSNLPSLTYADYFAYVKPKPEASTKPKGYVCKICGYVYEGEMLPPDFVCPLCKHGAEDFEPLR